MDVSATWMFASGNRTTIQVDSYFSPEKEIRDGNESYYSPWEPVYKRNAAKLGNYHRLDVSFNFYQPKKRGRMGVWNVSVYNVYCRMNPFFIDGVVQVNQYGNLLSARKDLFLLFLLFHIHINLTYGKNISVDGMVDFVLFCYCL
ncbi:MAG: hypothetical protein LUD02_12990 [Tannerellaceae bacterium]|nr:hypothetical protein [Tannerellaceae bacterium]MCD8264947.1 hypothetical protein [Tannerellaceae bacterium]